MKPTDLRGVAGISGPYSVRKLVTDTSRFVRFATYWMTVRHAFGTEPADWDASDPGLIAVRRRHEEERQKAKGSSSDNATPSLLPPNAAAAADAAAVGDTAAAGAVNESIALGDQQQPAVAPAQSPAAAAVAGAGSRASPPEFVLLVGDEEVEQAQFEDQMRCLGASLKESGHAVHTAIIQGKSHATMVRHLGAVSAAAAPPPSLSASLSLSPSRSCRLTLLLRTYPSPWPFPACHASEPRWLD
jgi:hypothetical protein